VSVVFTALQRPSPLRDERVYTSVLLLLTYAACLRLTRCEHLRSFSGSSPSPLLIFHLLQTVLYILYGSPLSASSPLVSLALPIISIVLLAALLVLEYFGPLQPLPSAVDLTPCPVGSPNNF